MSFRTSNEDEEGGELFSVGGTISRAATGRWWSRRAGRFNPSHDDADYTDPNSLYFHQPLAVEKREAMIPPRVRLSRVVDSGVSTGVVVVGIVDGRRGSARGCALGKGRAGERGDVGGRSGKGERGAGKSGDACRLGQRDFGGCGPTTGDGGRGTGVWAGTGQAWRASPAPARKRSTCQDGRTSTQDAARRAPHLLGVLGSALGTGGHHWLTGPGVTGRKRGRVQHASDGVGQDGQGARKALANCGTRFDSGRQQTRACPAPALPHTAEASTGRAANGGLASSPPPG